MVLRENVVWGGLFLFLLVDVCPKAILEKISETTNVIIVLLQRRVIVLFRMDKLTRQRYEKIVFCPILSCNFKTVCEILHIETGIVYEKPLFSFFISSLV